MTSPRHTAGGLSFALLAVLGLAIVPAPANEPPAPATRPRVEVRTSVGPFVVELFPELAPRNVELFLERAGLRPRREGVGNLVGSEVCASWPHGYLVFGCLPAEPGRPSRPIPESVRAPDEIDGVAMGLGEEILDDPARVDLLWQLELWPRVLALEGAGRPLPRGLAHLAEQIRREGPAAARSILGWSRLRLLEAAGWRWTPGGSPLRVRRGVLATANRWPGEADARFLVALADLPERDGRATVWGRVVAGWTTLDAIADIPLDNEHRPRQPVTILGFRELPEAASTTTETSHR